MTTTKTKFFLVACLAVALSSGLCLRGEEPSKAAAKFDAAKIPPPNPRKGKPVARVYYDYLYADQIKAPAKAHEPDVQTQIAAFIWGPLKKRYIHEHKIEATAAEVEAFVRFMRKAEEKHGAAVSEKDDKDVKAAWEVVGRDSVLRWKFNRELYKQYGGTVIFQQANPLEPVGAYKEFLEEMERRKCFEIFDRKARDKFWEYYRKDPKWVVPPEDINFDKPWWEQVK